MIYDTASWGEATNTNFLVLKEAWSFFKILI